MRRRSGCGEPGQLAGAADDEPGRQGVDRGRRVVAVHPLEQQPSRFGADGGRVLRHDGDARFDDVGQGHVVETDEGDGVVQAQLVEGLDDADGDEVLAAEDSVGSRRGEDLTGGVPRLTRGAKPMADEFGPAVGTDLGEGVAEA